MLLIRARRGIKSRRPLVEYILTTLPTRWQQPHRIGSLAPPCWAEVHLTGLETSRKKPFAAIASPAISKVSNSCPSVRIAIISEPNVRISFKFWLLLSLCHTLGCFKFFLIFSLTWDPMGGKISKRDSYKSQPKVVKLVLNFPPNGPHKNTFGIFEISISPL